MVMNAQPSSPPLSPATTPLREVVGLFPSSSALQDAIRALEGTEFPRQDISVMGSEADLEKVFGTKTVDAETAMDNDQTPREAPARPEEQTIGVAAMIGGGTYVGAMALALAAGAATFPAIIGAAILGGVGGGALSAALTKLLGDRYNHHIDEQVRKGGLLLWVRTPDAGKEDLAMSIMTRYGGEHVHAHEIH